MKTYNPNRGYTKQQVEAWFDCYKPHISHVVVAHTHHRPYVASMDKGRFKYGDTEKYLNAKIAETSKSTRYAMNCLNAFLYPNHTNRVRRNDQNFKPLAFVTIEGAKETKDRAKTIHINILLGNLPRVLTTEDIETIFRHFWHEKAKQKDDVWVDNYDGRPWGGYSLKEAQQDPSRMWNESSILDVANCWIPHCALNED